MFPEDAMEALELPETAVLSVDDSEENEPVVVVVPEDDDTVQAVADSEAAEAVRPGARVPQKETRQKKSHQ